MTGNALQTESPGISDAVYIEIVLPQLLTYIWTNTACLVLMRYWVFLSVHRVCFSVSLADMKCASDKESETSCKLMSSFGLQGTSLQAIFSPFEQYILKSPLLSGSLFVL